MPVSKEERDRRVVAGLCEQCGSNPCEGSTRKCRSCKEKNGEGRERSRQKRRDRGLCTQPGCKNPAKPGCDMCQPCITKSSEGTSKAYRKKKDAGFCPYCATGTPCAEDKRACRKCLDRISKAGVATYAECKVAGICYFCPQPKPSALPGTAYCVVDRLKGLIRSRLLNTKRRKKVLDYYGRACACCGLTIEAALQIDHIHGGGNEHRREIGRGGLYRWLIMNKFPEGFQTLCVLCNWMKSHYGACPHATMSYEAMELTLNYTKALSKIMGSGDSP